VECGSSARNWALELAEPDVGVEVMLLCARDRKLRHCGERSTATRRWRPSGGGACVASAGDAREGGEQRWGRQEATRGHQKLELELGVLHRR
jgi:hypothetical protein